MEMNREIKQILFDELGNLRKEYEIIRYEKYSDGEWHECRRFESGRSWFVIEGKIYSICDNVLIEANMDFNSTTHGACYTIGKLIEGKRKIIGNEILFKEKTNFENGMSLELHKQSYSDGTCFYSLQDSRGNFSLNHGSRNIHDLLKQIEIEKQLSIEGKRDGGRNNKTIQEIYDEMIRFYDAVISELKRVA